MAHEIFGERFLDARGPAWHKLGQVCREPLSAAAAFDKIGQYKVETVGLTTASGIAVPGYQAILRHPTTDDPQFRIFGVTTDEYHLITPWEFVNIFDEHVAAPVETLGSLRHGAVMFITTFLREYSVKGDECKAYLQTISPMNGGEAVEVLRSDVRMVCANTMRMAQSAATERYRLQHDANTKQLLAHWLRDMWSRAEKTHEVLMEAFNILAAHRVKGAEERDLVLARAYPLQNTVTQDAPPDTIAHWQQDIDYRNSRQLVRRDAAKSLFEGDGRGMDTKAAKGTAWGLYQAVCETEDYRRGGTNIQAAASALFGLRALAKERAFEAALEISRN